MKQISLKVLIVATAALAAPTAFAFLHGAALPDYGSWPDASEAYVYRQEYRGAQVNENGTVSDFSGSGYVQLVSAWRGCYVEDFIPDHDFSIWGYGHFAVEMTTADMLFYNYCYGHYPDHYAESILRAKPALLSDDGDGGFYIKERPLDPSPNNDDDIRFKVNDVQDIDDPHPRFPYDSLHNIDSYALFLNEDNSCRPFNYRIVLDYKLTLTDRTTPLPPHEGRIVPCQIISQSVADLVQVASEPQIHQQGVMVNSVMVGDTLYIQGLFPSKAGVWLRGSIEGDKVTFKRGSIAAMSDSISYLSTYDMDVKDDGRSRYTYTFSPLDDDLFFKFDRSTFTLSEPNHAFAAMPDIEGAWSYTADTCHPCPIPAFIDANGSKLEDKPLTPSKPQFIGIDGDYWNLWSTSGSVNFAISNISEEGEMMYADKLFYTVKVGDKPVTITPQQWAALEGDTTEIPYLYTSLGRYGEKDGDVWACGYERDLFFYSPVIYDIYHHPIEIRLVYKGGGEERWSEPLVCGTPNSVDEIDSPDAADAPAEIYNLQGVYVGAGLGDLAKGVYLMKRGTKTEKVYKR